MFFITHSLDLDALSTSESSDWRLLVWCLCPAKMLVSSFLRIPGVVIFFFCWELLSPSVPPDHPSVPSAPQTAGYRWESLSLSFVTDVFILSSCGCCCGPRNRSATVHFSPLYRPSSSSLPPPRLLIHPFRPCRSSRRPPFPAEKKRRVSLKDR